MELRSRTGRRLAVAIVALVLAAALTTPAFRRGLAGRSDRTGGGAAAAFTALPDFLLASVLLVVAYFATTAKRREYEADEAPEDRLSDEDFRRIEFGDEDI